MMDEEAQFLLRHRLPRPISRAYEAVCFALDEEEVLQRSRWCAKVALRFVGALRQASRLAGGLPAGGVDPPSLHDLRAAGEDQGLFPPELDRGLPFALLQLAAVYGAQQISRPREELSGALAQIDWLARYRLAIVEPTGLRLLLGPRIEYRIGCGQLVADGGTTPPSPGTPLLIDPESGRFISLAPLLSWSPEPKSPFGHLLVLRRVQGGIGHYVEEGVPGCPGGQGPLAGWPAKGLLSPELRRAHLASPQVCLPDGCCADGLYDVQGLIWRGGTSDIFAARRRSDGRAVVLKTFEYEPGLYDENFWRFFEEQRFAAGVRHPGVLEPHTVRLRACGLAHETELVGRGSLADLLDIQGTLPLAQALAIAAQLFAALAAIHRSGIAHNDIKPENLLFDDDGSVKLIDFGIASPLAGRKAERLLRPGVPAGTPGYIAPEVAAGEAPSVQSDIFAAGMVLLQMLGGEPEVLEGDRVPGFLRGRPAELGSFLRRCLDARPDRRHTSAEEAGAVLRRLQATARPSRAITLDIEGTLVTNHHEKAPRPGLSAFLQLCLDRFDRIFIYTLLSEEEAREVFSSLAERALLPDGFLERYEYVSWPRGRDGSLKDLRRCRHALAENLIVDDAEAWIPEDQTHRWVPVPEFGEATGFDRGLFMASATILAKLR